MSGETDLCCGKVLGTALEQEFSERYDGIEYQPKRKKKRKNLKNLTGATKNPKLGTLKSTCK
jgi:hypothetical protein